MGGGKSYLDTICSTAGFKLEPLSKKGGLGDQLGNTTLLIGQKAHGGSEQPWSNQKGGAARGVSNMTQ